MTHTDPSADAFMRRILSNPADAVPRLVFADWLEESGTSSNLAWARYLRLADELANAPPDDARRPKMAAELAKVGSLIRARLTCRAEVLVAYPDAMRQLLPARCIVAKLEGVMPPQSVLELVPESVARQDQVLPLARLTDRTLILAAAYPTDRHLDARLRFILNCPVEFVGLVDTEFADCLNRNYGNTETESVESVTYRWLPNDGLRGGPPETFADLVVAFWNLVILEAIEYIAPALQLEIDGTRLAVWHQFRGERRRHEYSPNSSVVAQLVPTLRLFLRNPVSVEGGSTRGEITVVFWGRPRTHIVHITERPNGFTVRISIPPYPTGEPAALNPAA